MKIKIAENIRAFRKERKMTQEQLAEALGVTIGAVSKWESGACMPDVGLIVEMAGFFETSVDVLLGYDLQAGGMGRAVARIKDLRNEKRFDEASGEAEQALQKYPNSFDVVYCCAVLYCMKGIERRCEKSMRRALELFERSLTLLKQNTNPHISEWTIRNNIADACVFLGQTDEALERMKANNAGGLNDDAIGSTLVKLHRPDEALPYLSDALVRYVSNNLMRVATGLTNAYCDKKDYASAMAATDWFRSVLDGLRKPNEISFLDMEIVQLWAATAQIALMQGDEARAREALKQAGVEAKRFDAAPSYGYGNMRFFNGTATMTAFSDFGDTAATGIEKAIRENEDCGKRLGALWAELRNEQKG